MSMQSLHPWVYNSLYAPEPKEENRLVLFVGPHKTASTSLQWFFSHNGTNDFPDFKLPALEQWSWPRFNYHDNGNLLYSFTSDWLPSKLKRYKNKIYHDYNTSHLILGTENFCRFEETGSIDLILNWTATRHPEMIVHYRTPRTDHWLSLWKQFTRIGKPAENYTFYDYLCMTENPFPEYMDPLGLVSKLLQRQWKTHLMDMAGVQLDGLDITHTIACEILQVPCDNGWIQGYGGQMEKRNVRSGNANLTDAQYHAFENVLQQHDCSFKNSLVNNANPLTIHHWKELWKECNLYYPSNIEHLANFSIVVDVLREITKCPKYAALPKRSYLYGPQAKMDPSFLVELDQRTSLLADLHSNINFLTFLVFSVFFLLLCSSQQSKKGRLLGYALKNKLIPKKSTNMNHDRF